MALSISDFRPSAWLNIVLDIRRSGNNFVSVKVVFIHNGLDASSVDRYTAKIRASCEIRPWSMAGATADDVVVHADLLELIGWADVVVILINSTVTNSLLVNSAIRYARSLNKRVIIIREEEDCSLPPAADDFADAVVPCEDELVWQAIAGEIDGGFQSGGHTLPARSIPHHKC